MSFCRIFQVTLISLICRAYVIFSSSESPRLWFVTTVCHIGNPIGKRIYIVALYCLVGFFGRGGVQAFLENIRKLWLEWNILSRLYYYFLLLWIITKNREILIIWHVGGCAPPFALSASRYMYFHCFDWCTNTPTLAR